MREYKDTKKACSPVKNKLHAFVYIDDNVYINARGKVSLMCVCVCVCVLYKNQKRPNLRHGFLPLRLKNFCRERHWPVS